MSRGRNGGSVAGIRIDRKEKGPPDQAALLFFADGRITSPG
jgi:hypothetical protein